jgi:hypothetical protein
MPFSINVYTQLSSKLHPPLLLPQWMQTGLILASTNGHLEVVQLLLEHKADVCAADEVKNDVLTCRHAFFRAAQPTPNCC